MTSAKPAAALAKKSANPKVGLAGLCSSPSIMSAYRLFGQHLLALFGVALLLA